jgi:hypothetical protein
MTRSTLRGFVALATALALTVISAGIALADGGPIPFPH